MACIPAPACKAALAQATELWPKRSRVSDGVCASATHSSQNSSSDHERGEAFDLTHDPPNGCDAHYMIRELAERRDPRVKYLISRGQIWNPSISYAWRTYNGSNPHNKHAHVSIRPHARYDVKPWWTSTPEPLDEENEMIIVSSIDPVAVLPIPPNRRRLLLSSDGGGCVIRLAIGSKPSPSSSWVGSIEENLLVQPGRRWERDLIGSEIVSIKWESGSSPLGVAFA